MKMMIRYFDNEILLDDNSIFVIEIENKKCFFRLVRDLYSMKENLVDDIQFFDEEFKEINLVGKIYICVDYFNISLDFKKYNNDISKYIFQRISDKTQTNIIKIYQMLLDEYTSLINDSDLSLSIKNDINIENITKTIKLEVNQKEQLLDNLLLLIDIEKVLNTKRILFLINLKQYLSSEELEELYKYALYNQVKIILIDSQSYGVTIKYEKKLIIDKNLDEFMIQSTKF